jgi:hypothetical protein
VLFLPFNAFGAYDKGQEDANTENWQDLFNSENLAQDQFRTNLVGRDDQVGQAAQPGALAKANFLSTVTQNTVDDSDPYALGQDAATTLRGTADLRARQAQDAAAAQKAYDGAYSPSLAGSDAGTQAQATGAVKTATATANADSLLPQIPGIAARDAQRAAAQATTGAINATDFSTEAQARPVLNALGAALHTPNNAPAADRLLHSLPSIYGVPSGVHVFVASDGTYGIGPDAAHLQPIEPFLKGLGNAVPAASFTSAGEGSIAQPKTDPTMDLLKAVQAQYTAAKTQAIQQKVSGGSAGVDTNRVLNPGVPAATSPNSTASSPQGAARPVLWNQVAPATGQDPRIAAILQLQQQQQQAQSPYNATYF